jgi:hypothetical protein
LPGTSRPSPSINVTCPTAIPATSVMALKGPGCPENGMPKSRPRDRVCARPESMVAAAQSSTRATRRRHTPRDRPDGQ